MFTTPFAFMAAPAGGGFDPDAQTYIDAVIAAGGTLSSPDQDTVNTLFVDLKTAGLYSKMTAMYPVVGATGPAHALNAVNPVNSDAAFRLNFIGTWVHDSGGMTNNSTGGANTYMLNSVDLTQGDRHFSFYSTVDTEATGYDWGGGAGSENVLICSYNGSTFYTGFAEFLTYSNTDSRGFYIANLKSGTQRNILNGVSVASQASGDTSINRYISLMCDNRAGVPGFNTDEPSPNTCAFASVGDGFTQTEWEDLSTIVQTFQTSLGRQV
jgi:hypothetical protein